MQMSVSFLLNLIPEAGEMLFTRDSEHFRHRRDIAVCDAAQVEMMDDKEAFIPLKSFNGRKDATFHLSDPLPSTAQKIVDRIPEYMVYELVGGDPFHAPTYILCFAEKTREGAGEWMIKNTPNRYPWDDKADTLSFNHDRLVSGRGRKIPINYRVYTRLLP